MRFPDVKQSWRFLRAELRGMTLALALLISLAFLLVLGLAPNFPILFSFLGDVSIGTYLQLLGGLILGILTSAEWYVTLILVIVSLLSGLNIALVVARSKRLRVAGATGVGSVLGLTLAGCPSCATGLLPLFGVTLGAGLPLGGIEFSVFGIAVLLLALYWNTRAELCRV